MSPCICFDDSHPMFKVLKGAHYWQPVIEKTIKEGDLVYFEITETGVKISLTDNINMTFIFFSREDFYKHFEDKSIKRNNIIKNLLK